MRGIPAHLNDCWEINITLRITNKSLMFWMFGLIADAPTNWFYEIALTNLGRQTCILKDPTNTRGSFQSSLLESCGTEGIAPYKKVLTHGFVLDEKGYKMSKSIGNVVAPNEIINKQGADLLRLWIVSADYSDDMRIGSEIIRQQEDIYRRLRNTLRYLLGALDGYSAAEKIDVKDMPELERWIFHKLAELQDLHDISLANLDFTGFYAALHTFCTVDLSAFYFDIRKDCLYCDPVDSLRRKATRTAMHHVFDHLVHWLAPVLALQPKKPTSLAMVAMAKVSTYPNSQIMTPVGKMQNSLKMEENSPHAPSHHGCH